MESRNEVKAFAGRGLEGDRYFLHTGKYSAKEGADRELTLIELETLEALDRENNIKFELGDSRRNIVTRGVPLNHLVGREFKVGSATARGIRLCEPCGYMENLTQPGAKAALIHRGGLRAQILTDGTIRVGDSIEYE